MRSNRKTTTRMSIVATRSFSAATIIAVLFVVVMINMLASSRCNQLMKANGECERQLERLEDEFQRETVRWNEMLQPERLESALRNNGMAMRYPKASQNVRVGRDGVVIPSQMSVALANQRSQNSRFTASSASSPRSSASQRRQAVRR